MTDALPILAVLPDLAASLADGGNAVVIAPPGAGKTTMIAPALLDAGWVGGRQIWLLGPRRLAVRAAAERMAAQAGVAVGGRIGYATRLDSRQSAATQLLVMTHGLFRNRIIADPELTGVAAVLFDEVHERSIDSDLGLALACDAQAGLRPDLRLVAMSATLDGARFAALLGDAPQFVSEGRSHSLAIHHIGRNPAQRLDDAMAAAIRDALAAGPGDVLAFLPGVADLARTAERLAGRDGLAVHQLHGQVPVAAQRAALAPDPDGRRKIILATSIAETSLTIDGVRIVVDSGLARRPRFDPAVGTARLVTERASQAAATQRAGRAARQGPGTAWRLWEAAATRGLPQFDPPEMLEADLAPLLLDCAAWGVGDPAQLAWLDAPPAAGVAEARRRLIALGALDNAGRLTPHGRAMAAFPLSPPLAHMMLAAARGPARRLAAELAVLLGERGVGGPSVDLENRLARWRQERGDRADGARRLARRFTDLADASSAGPVDADVGALLAAAWPDRVARRRSGDGGEWLSVGGRAYRLDPADPLAAAPWLVVADAVGQASGARIVAAAAIDPARIDAMFAGRIETRITNGWNDAADRVDQRLERRLGAIRLGSGPLPGGRDVASDVAARLAVVKGRGMDAVVFGPAAGALRRRAAYADIDALSDDALLADVDDWLAPVLAACRGLADVPDQRLQAALLGRLDWAARDRLDRIAPAQFRSPAGTSHDIDYAAPAGPTVTLRVQALFGMAQHPVVGTPPVALVLSLTSPAGRPIQTTRDLPGFWAGSWREVKADMRGRYPRHNWPDDPAAAVPSLRTKAAEARRR